MDKVVAWICSDVGRTVIYGILYLLSLLFGLIAAKIKNSKMKNILLILPEAMEWAEYQGDTPDKKLDLCTEYVLNRVKKASPEFIKKLIEPYIKMTKVVNSTIVKKPDSIKSRSTM